MNILKRFVFAFLIVPVLSFAALEASYTDISPACYRTFKTTFNLLPAIASDYGYGVSNMKTPAGNPSTFTFTVDYTPSAAGLGDYELYQKYSNNTLFLRLDSYPDTFPVDSADEVWEVVGSLLKICPILDEIK